MEGLRADIVHALRLYSKSPAASALAVAVLAAAMAVVTAFVSLWNHLGLRPHPGFEDSRAIVTIGLNDGRRFLPISRELIELIDRESTTIASIAGVGSGAFLLEREDEAEPLSSELVTASFFPEIRPRLAIGRPFEASDHDPDAAPVAILSYGFWQEEFGGRADVLGRTLRVRDGTPRPEPDDLPKTQEHRIVGVMAAELPGTFNRATEVWLPYEQVAAFQADGPAPPGALLRGLARRAPGVSVASAATELAGRFDGARLENRLPFDGRMDAIAGVVSNANRHRDTLRQVRLFLAGGILLAFVAAANVSLFLLSRAPGRRRELATRMAVGAPIRRLARQLVTESSVLVLAGALAGLLASLWLAVVVQELPLFGGNLWQGLTVFDWRVLALVGALTLVLAVLVALAPVVGLKKIGIAAESRAVTARPGWGQRLAATVQLTVAAVTAAAALAFAWHAQAMATAPRGWAAPGVFVLTPEPPERPTAFEPVDEAAVQERARRRDVIASLPGVARVTFATIAPGSATLTFLMQASSADDPTDVFGFDQFNIGTGYLEMLGARLIAGRAFAEEDRDGIVVNATLARRIWGRTDVAGELFPLARPANAPPAPRIEVIGVIEDIVFGHPTDDMPPMAFRLIAAGPPFELILVESELTAAALTGLLEDRAEAGDLDVRIRTIERLEDAWLRPQAPDRARMAVGAATALFVVVLAALGYYGTQRFLVAAGRREFAILGALGAGPRALGRLVLGRGLVQGLPGAVLGGLLAFTAVAWLEDGFVSTAVAPAAVTLIVVAGVLALVLAASAGPARRAAHTEPAPLLKEE